MSIKNILFASTNTGKFEEFKKLISLDSTHYNVISLRELGYNIPPCEETGTTFIENAILKVQHTKRYLHGQDTDMLIIGDDSGISIHALGGKPGVHTRRWNGHEMTDNEITEYCLEQLIDKTDRTADYVTVYAILFPHEVTPRIIEGTTRGTILKKPRIESYAPGVPFRALFYIPGLGMMFHEARELPFKQRKHISIGHEDALKECRQVIIEYGR